LTGKAEPKEWELFLFETMRLLWCYTFVPSAPMHQAISSCHFAIEADSAKLQVIVGNFSWQIQVNFICWPQNPVQWTMVPLTVLP
jgi:hypothetical protein